MNVIEIPKYVHIKYTMILIIELINIMIMIVEIISADRCAIFITKIAFIHLIDILYF